MKNRKIILIICTIFVLAGLITAVVLLALNMHKMKAEIGRLSNEETKPVTEVDTSDGSINPALSGKIGDNLTWKIDPETFTLTIEGKGDMDDSFDGSTMPTYYHLYKDKVQSVEIGDEVTSIAPYAFQYFTSVGDIWIGDSVKTIGENAFTGCENLQNVVFDTEQSDLQTIGTDVFYLCEYLHELELPDGYINFEADLENGERLGLENIPVIFSENNSEYVCEDGCVYNSDKTKLIYCPLSSDYPYNENEKVSFAIPDTVTVIGTEAFHSNVFDSLTIPGSIKTVEVYSLPDIAVQNLFFEEGVQTVNNTGIRGVKTVTIADSIVSIHEDTFPKYNMGEIKFTENSKALKKGKDNSVYTKDGKVLLWVSEDSIYNPKEDDYPGFTVPEGVERIASSVITDKSFYSSRAELITGFKLSLPDSLKSIGDDNFNYINFGDDYTLELPKNLSEIGYHCFAGCSMYAISIPKSVVEIGDEFLEDTKCIVDRDYEHPTKTILIIEDKTAWEKIGYKDLDEEFEIKYSKTK